MWVMQVQNDLVGDTLVSLDRAECFALEKKNTQEQLHSSSKIVSLRSQRFRRIQMYKINFVCRVIYARAADLMHALQTCLFTDTHFCTLTCLMTYSGQSTTVHYPQKGLHHHCKRYIIVDNS